jgi:hypothetical protein
MDPTGKFAVLTSNRPVAEPRRAKTAKCAETDDATTDRVSLPAGRLRVSKGNPWLAMLQVDGAVLGSSPASRRFRSQKETFSVSADGTIIGFGFEGGKSQFRFGLRALKLSDERPADGRTPQPNQNGLRSKIGPSTLWRRRQNPRPPQGPAISADEFQHKVAELAKYGRVLVLFDACHSGGVAGDGSALTSNVNLLPIIAACNVTCADVSHSLTRSSEVRPPEVTQAIQAVPRWAHSMHRSSASR